MNDIMSKGSDEIYCPSCAKPVKKEAVVCPSCGVQVKDLKTPSEISSSVSVDEVFDARKQLGGIKAWSWFVIVLSGLFFIVISIVGVVQDLPEMPQISPTIGLLFTVAVWLALFIVPLIGIAKRKPFAIPLTRYMLIISMFLFPIGTIIGAVLWKRTSHPSVKKYLNYNRWNKNIETATITPVDEVAEGRKQLGGIKIWFWLVIITSGLFFIALIVNIVQGLQEKMPQVAPIIGLLFTVAVWLALFIVPLVGIAKRKPFAVPFTRAMLIVSMFWVFIGTIVGTELWRRINNPFAKKYLNYKVKSKYKENPDNLPTAISQPKNKLIAVLLTVFFGIFGWLYTWKKSYRDFLQVFSFLLVVFILYSIFKISYILWVVYLIWLGAVIDTARKPKSYYTNYPNENYPKERRSWF